jgi:hypothetical protein
MATREQLRRMVSAQPFQPFVVRLTGGRVFTVRHPELVACDVQGRGMTIEDEQGSHPVEMLLIEVMEPLAPPTNGDQGAKRGPMKKRS